MTQVYTVGSGRLRTMRADGVVGVCEEYGQTEPVLAGWCVKEALTEGSRRGLRIVGSAAEVMGLTLSGPGARERAQEAIERLVKGSLLREYQGHLLRQIFCGPGEKILRGYLTAPAGSGKTRIAAAIPVVHFAATWNLGGDSEDWPRSAWGYIVQSKQLAAQTQKQVGGSAVNGVRPIGLLYDMARAVELHFTPDLDCFSFGDAWVGGGGSAGSPGKRYAEFMACGNLIVDEVHRVPCTTAATPVLLSQAVCRIGLSATPVSRGDGTGAMVEGLLGPELASVSLKEVTDAGFLTQGKVWDGEAR